MKNSRERVLRLKCLIREEVLINLLLAILASLVTLSALLVFVIWDFAWKRPLTIITILVGSALTVSFASVSKL